MLDKNLLASIFKTYGINNVLLIEDSSRLNFVISNMDINFNLDKWEYLENILKDVTKSEVNIMSYYQVSKYLGEDYLSKGESIIWKTDTNY